MVEGRLGVDLEDSCQGYVLVETAMAGYMTVPNCFQTVVMMGKEERQRILSNRMMIFQRL